MDTNTPVHLSTTKDSSPDAPIKGHGPWMLMSYKNRKMNSAKAPSNLAATKPGSIFAILQTYNAEGENAMQEEPFIQDDQVSKHESSSELKIVKVWKKVKEKLAQNGENTKETTSKSTIYAESPPKSTVINSSKVNVALKDITNDKSPAVIGIRKTNTTKTSDVKSSVPPQPKKHSILKHDPARKPPFPSLNSLING
ncbi:uncharacterized protein LOC112177246 [Rosa chinensis]|nr:uncharacterized protein LOC112177246 [Rosa chinensis]